MTNFDDFFKCATRAPEPHHWQREVAENGLPDILSVPTGLGKTEGAALAWAWRRLVLQRQDEPRHLIYCLPMRVLVQQTVARLRECFSRLHQVGAIPSVPIFPLMGGEIDEGWQGIPEEPWVLVGTQDQLLSRALNRGYLMRPYNWPVHFGFLNNDCRWIVDEVQLMGPGLGTTAQLDWMRRCRFKTIGPCRTTWMSATVGTVFLDTTDRLDDELGSNSATRYEHPIQLPSKAGADLKERLAARRPVMLAKPSAKMTVSIEEWLAIQVSQEHLLGTLSLVVCNTVLSAQKIYKALPDQCPKVLLTARFRPAERGSYEHRLLDFEERRKAAGGEPVDQDPGLICVSTQVVEAGLDISSHRLWSEIAPWPSVVQRLGRLNRDGRANHDAHAVFWPAAKPSRGSERSGPYLWSDLQRAERLLRALEPVSQEHPSPLALRMLDADEVRRALTPPPTPLPRAETVHGLFSTERDVHGGFTDVSQFVRGIDFDADVTVFWRSWSGIAPPHRDVLEGPPLAPDETCSVHIWELEKVLQGQQRAWAWNEDQERWEPVPVNEIRPGMTLMLHASAGGYSCELGWTSERSDRLTKVPSAGPARAYRDDPRSELGYWARLTDHLNDAKKEAETLVKSLALPADLGRAVIEASAWHDLGKAHPQWLAALPGRRGDELLAKAPPVLHIECAPMAQAEVEAEIARRYPLAQRVAPPDLMAEARTHTDVILRWALPQRIGREPLNDLRSCRGVRTARIESFRPGLRHEAATALAMWHRYLAGNADWPALAVYLAASHHGKVRTVLRARSHTGDDVCGVPRDTSPLQFSGDWPLDLSVAADGADGEWTDAGFELHGPGWTGLVAELLGPWRCDEHWEIGAVSEGEPKALGPFRLAYLEALVRIADWRASAHPSIAQVPGEQIALGYPEAPALVPNEVEPSQGGKS